MNYFKKIFLGSLIAVMSFGAVAPTVFAFSQPQITPERRQELIQARKNKAAQLKKRASALWQKGFDAARRKNAGERRFKVKNFEAIKKIKLDKSQFNNARNGFRRARDEFRRDKGNFDKRKQMLIHLVDSLIRHSELLKKRVDKFSVIDNDLEASIIAEIDFDISKLEEFKTRVEAAATAEELKTLAQELRSHRKDITQKKVRKLMLFAHIGVFEHRALKIVSERADRIEARLNNLKDQGKDVSGLEELLADARAGRDAAASALEDLKASINNQDISDVKLREIRTSFQNIRVQIKEIFQIFRQIAEGAQNL